MKLKPVISALAIIGLVGATIALGWSLPQASPQTQTVARYLPVGQTHSLTCTGALARTVSQGINVETQAETLDVSTAIFVNGGRWVDGETGQSSAPRTINASGKTFNSAQGSGSVFINQTQAATQRVMGGTYARIGGGDMRGLAINPCQWARQSMWLVGSQAGVGTYNVLSVANPGDQPITVSVAAFGERGRVDFAGSPEISVAPQAKVEVNLDGLLADTAQLALHLTSDSGPFSATLQTNELDGFTPRGISVVTNSDFATSLVMPGLVVTQPANVAPGADSEDQRATLRIVNPHDEELTADITVLGNDVEPLPGTPSVTLPAQSVLDLTLDGLSAGSYSVGVDSEKPLTASIKVAVASGEATDSAWIAGQLPIEAGGAMVKDQSQLIVGSPNPPRLYWLDMMMRAMRFIPPLKISAVRKLS